MKKHTRPHSSRSRALMPILGVVVMLISLPAFALEDEAVGDARVVNFYLPAEFEQALADAKESNRLLLIKGVAFGVDQLGATCATKGHW